MKIYVQYLLILFSSIVLFSCKSTRYISQDESTTTARTIEQYFERSATLNSYHVGFGLYDIGEKEWVFQHQTDKFFTPASNTKLLTLNAALQYLGDSIEFVRVYEQGEKFIYQPMGDPSFLHPGLETPSRIQTYFKEHHTSGDTIYFHTGHFQSPRFGSGWAWGDYEYSYQTELSPFPIHSNYVILNKDNTLSPDWAAMTITIDDSIDGSYFRDLLSNNLVVRNPSEGPYEIPFVANEEFWNSYFEDQGMILKVVNEVDLSESDFKGTVHSMPVEPVYELLMQQSDNHIAEQLLLQVGYSLTGKMNSSEAIDTLMNSLYSNDRDGLRWVDGSGLSRYNIFQPQIMVDLVNDLVEEYGLERIKNILPAGGVRGTIKNWYSYDEGPRIFAKTGTLRHNHCLTGLVQSRSGKWYSFSFMNNNYPGGSSTAKVEMQNVLDLIVEEY